MNTLEAIQYLIKNSKASNEWQEAGMWNAVIIVTIGNVRKFWTTAELQILIKNAMNY